MMPFWFLDFRFWIHCYPMQIQNPKSKIEMGRDYESTLAGLEIRHEDLSKDSRLHAHRGVVDCAWHRREHIDLHIGKRGVVQTDAGAASRATGGAVYHRAELDIPRR